MGLRKKWKPPTLDQLFGPMKMVDVSLMSAFWPKFRTVISWNKAPKVIEETQPYIRTFTFPPCTKCGYVFKPGDMGHSCVPPLIDVSRCQVCGAPGCTLCPWCDIPGMPPRTMGERKEAFIDWYTALPCNQEERIIPMGDTTRPQKDPKPGKTSVTDLVLADIEERRKQGIAKYGTELRTQNGRKSLVDLYQELLDAVMYVRQAIEEQYEKMDEKGKLVSAQMLEQMDLFDPITFQRRTPPPVAPESVAQEAHRLVLGDRGAAYGHPIFDMTRSADMLTALLRDKLKVGVRLEAEDIGQAMICVKQSRHRNAAKRDNLTDTAGYSLTLQMIKEWRDEHPGADPRDHF